MDRTSASGPDLYLITDQDLIYEQDLLRDATSVKPWLSYIEFKQQNGTLYEQAFVCRRPQAISTGIGHKLFQLELDLIKLSAGYGACLQAITTLVQALEDELRTNHLKGRNPTVYRAEYQKVNALFEQALILLNKMPRIWEMYLSFLLQQSLITQTRTAFDRSLRALPATQHNRIWRLYKGFARSASGPAAIKTFARYMQIHPENIEEYIELLAQMGEYTEAVKKFIQVLDNPRFQPKEGKSPFQLWTEMVDLLVSKAKKIHTGPQVGIDVDAILRSGIQRFADQRGKLWAGLATYWTTRGNFEKARDVFEEGITTVMTVRDFTLIFDSYVEFEESVIGNLMERAAIRTEKGKVDEESDFDLDLRMLRFEQLMDRRPFLVNDVLLRQNPHNVIEWGKRVALWGDNKPEAVQTYTNAIAAIDPKKAHGKFSELWINFAQLYENGGDLDTARVVFDKAVKVPLKSVAELAETWCEWAEMELRADNFDKAVSIMAKATQAPKKSTVDYFDETLSPQQRIHKSWKLWSFYVDLVESVSSLDETKKVYERIFELRIATPQTVVNYANLLEENKYFEESFKVYERGLELFTYPVAFELWNLYLTKAVDRNIGIERLRDLFEQALHDCPPKFAKPLFLMYGNLEEERGLARHAMRIYERATRAVSDEDRLEMFKFYITKSASNFGIPYTRPIYDHAISSLPDREAAEMCLKYAEMEVRLDEVDRARGIFVHGSQFCDPRINKAYWDAFARFEDEHGNDDTSSEYQRLRRSVQDKFNTDLNYIASQAVARGQQQPQAGESTEDQESVDAMAELERQARAPVGFVAASSGPEGGNRPQPADQTQVAAAANPDAIDLDMDED